MRQGNPLELVNKPIPHVVLESITGQKIDLPMQLPSAAILYFYPATGTPGKDPAPGWETIPGAVGCTVQGMGFREFYPAFQKLGWEIIGISTQDFQQQAEFSRRKELPFQLLSDRELQLTTALRLPTFQLAQQTFIKRMAFVVRDGVIRHVFYPIDSPTDNARDVYNWLLQAG